MISHSRSGSIGRGTRWLGLRSTTGIALVLDLGELGACILAFLFSLRGVQGAWSLVLEPGLGELGISMQASKSSLRGVQGAWSLLLESPGELRA